MCHTASGATSRPTCIIPASFAVGLPRATERMASQAQWLSHYRHRLQSKGKVLLQRDPEVRDSQIYPHGSCGT